MQRRFPAAASLDRRVETQPLTMQSKKNPLVPFQISGDLVGQSACGRSGARKRADPLELQLRGYGRSSARGLPQAIFTTVSPAGQELDHRAF